MNFRHNALSNYKLVRQFSTNHRDFQKKSHYDSLEITPKATQGDVKSAYYKLSKKYHPDLNKRNPVAAADKFRDITEAYEVLGNLKSRKLYDRSLTVRGDTVYDHSSSRHEESVPDNYEHASFYHSRNKPSSKKTATDKKIQYDLDEWTKAHYSETFTKQFDKKVEGSTFNQERIQKKNEASTMLPVVTIFVLCIVGITLIGIDPSRQLYDAPTTKLTNEKPD